MEEAEQFHLHEIRVYYEQRSNHTITNQFNDLPTFIADGTGAGVNEGVANGPHLCLYQCRKFAKHPQTAHNGTMDGQEGEKKKTPAVDGAE